MWDMIVHPKTQCCSPPNQATKCQSTSAYMTTGKLLLLPVWEGKGSQYYHERAHTCLPYLGLWPSATHRQTGPDQSASASSAHMMHWPVWVVCPYDTEPSVTTSVSTWQWPCYLARRPPLAYGAERYSSSRGTSHMTHCFGGKVLNVELSLLWTMYDPMLPFNAGRST